MKILPAILTDRGDDLQEKIRQAEICTNLVQIDIMDGRFVPSRSINAGDLAMVKTRLQLELHLMILQPENQIADFVRAGATRIVFHYEATTDPVSVIHRIKSLNIKVGLALNPETAIEPLIELAPSLDFALFLSVNPGFYGSPFIPAVLDKIRDARSRGISLEIGIDGGINGGTIVAARDSGADYACVGSAIFNARSPADAFAELIRLGESPVSP